MWRGSVGRVRFEVDVMKFEILGMVLLVLASVMYAAPGDPSKFINTLTNNTTCTVGGQNGTVMCNGSATFNGSVNANGSASFNGTGMFSSLRLNATTCTVGKSLTALANGTVVCGNATLSAGVAGKFALFNGTNTANVSNFSQTGNAFVSSANSTFSLGSATLWFLNAFVKFYTTVFAVGTIPFTDSSGNLSVDSSFSFNATTHTLNALSINASNVSASFVNASGVLYSSNITSPYNASHYFGAVNASCWKWVTASVVETRC
jgi:hypothetical protein